MIYLGANEDAWAIGAGVGTAAAHTMSVDPGRFRLALDLSGLATAAYARSADRESERRNAAFSRDDRRRAKSTSRWAQSRALQTNITHSRKAQ